MNDVNKQETDGGISDIYEYQTMGEYKRTIKNSEAETLKYTQATSQRASIETELTQYKKDYANLVESEKELVNLIVVCKNTLYLVGSFENMLDRVTGDASGVNIPFFKKMFDFSNLRGSGTDLSAISSEIEDLKRELEHICIRIDKAKEKMAGDFVRLGKDDNYLIESGKNHLDMMG